MVPPFFRSHSSAKVSGLPDGTPPLRPTPPPSQTRAGPSPGWSQTQCKLEKNVQIQNMGKTVHKTFFLDSQSSLFTMETQPPLRRPPSSGDTGSRDPDPVDGPHPLEGRDGERRGGYEKESTGVRDEPRTRRRDSKDSRKLHPRIERPHATRLRSPGGRRTGRGRKERGVGSLDDGRGDPRLGPSSVLFGRDRGRSCPVGPVPSRSWRHVPSPGALKERGLHLQGCRPPSPDHPFRVRSPGSSIFVPSLGTPLGREGS